MLVVLKRSLDVSVGQYFSDAYQLICIIMPMSRWNRLQACRKGAMFVGGRVVPMCQSPKIADVVIQARKIPANDNGTSAATSIRSSKPAGTFNAAWQTLLILLCVIASLFFDSIGSFYCASAT
jgi:hypothetical protein